MCRKSQATCPLVTSAPGSLNMLGTQVAWEVSSGTSAAPHTYYYASMVSQDLT